MRRGGTAEQRLGETELTGGRQTGKGEPSIDEREQQLLSTLKRPGWLRRRLEELSEERDRCRSGCERTTARYGGAAVSGGYRDRGDWMLTELAELERKVRRCRDRLSQAEGEAEEVLRYMAAMPGGAARRDAETLRQRFLLGLTGERLRQAMAERGYVGNLQSVFYWQRTARRRGAAAWEAVMERRRAREQSGLSAH